MKFLERSIIYTTASDAEIMAKEKAFEVLAEKQGGIPKKRRYRCVMGKENTGTFVWEREWESFAAFEVSGNKGELQQQFAEVQKMEPDFSDCHWEIYQILED
jgi:hypothetical protein